METFTKITEQQPNTLELATDLLEQVNELDTPLFFEFCTEDEDLITNEMLQDMKTNVINQMLSNPSLSGLHSYFMCISIENNFICSDPPKFIPTHKLDQKSRINKNNHEYLTQRSKKVLTGTFTRADLNAVLAMAKYFCENIMNKITNTDETVLREAVNKYAQFQNGLYDLKPNQIDSQGFFSFLTDGKY